MCNLGQSEEMAERMEGRQSKSRAEAKQKMANNHQYRTAE